LREGKHYEVIRRKSDWQNQKLKEFLFVMVACLVIGLLRPTWVKKIKEGFKAKVAEIF